MELESKEGYEKEFILTEEEKELFERLERLYKYFFDYIIKVNESIYVKEHLIFIKTLCLVFKRENKITHYLIREYAEEYFNYCFVESLRGMGYNLRTFIFYIRIDGVNQYPIYDRKSEKDNRIENNEDFIEFTKKYKKSEGRLVRIAQALIWMSSKYF